MHRLILIDDPGVLNRTVQEHGLRNVHFFSFKGNVDPTNLNQDPSVDVKWVDPLSLFASMNKGFREDYAEWMGSLTRKNDSVFWSQLDLAGKSALSTRLCQRVFFMVCLQHILEVGPEDVVVCFADDIVVRQTIKNYKNIKIVDCRCKKPSLFELIFERLPVRMVYHFFLILGRKCVVGRSVFPKNVRHLAVIKTILSPDSFDGQGNYRDVYFGQLIDYLRKNRPHFIVVGIVLNSYRFCIKQIRRCGFEYLYSLEQILSFSDIAKSLLNSLLSILGGTFFRVKTIPFRGCEVGRIVREAVKDEVWAGRFFFNDINARTTRKLLLRNEVERFIFPFENRGWERADLMMIRSRGRHSQTIGYQHSAITQKHLEYYRSSNDPLPLPDRIISMGQITAKLLVDNGFPLLRVKPGPAFRQSGTFVQPLRRLASPLRFLVLLSTSVDYYQRTLTALKKIIPPQGEYVVRLRAHPLIPLKSISILEYPFPLTIDSARTCEEAIDGADVIIYSSSSTVALNCVQRGKPIFYVPVDDFLDADPLFELSDAKWTVRTREDFIQAMADVRSFSEEQWQERLSRAQVYVGKYFGPVTKAAMHLFLE